MSNTRMSVTRALAELKRLDDRIAKATSEGVFVTVSIGLNSKKKVLGSSGTVEQAASDIQSNYDRINELFKQRSKIKGKLVQSNAVTKLTLGAVEMTVAEAIELKRSISSKKAFVHVLRQQLTNANGLVARENAKLDAAIESNLATIYGNDKGKVEASMFDAIAKPQREQKEANLLDPVKLAEKIKSLDEEISLVDTELDFTLSEVNAKTEITL